MAEEEPRFSRNFSTLVFHDWGQHVNEYRVIEPMPRNLVCYHLIYTIEANERCVVEHTKLARMTIKEDLQDILAFATQLGLEVGFRKILKLIV